MLSFNDNMLCRTTTTLLLPYIEYIITCLTQEASHLTILKETIPSFLPESDKDFLYNEYSSMLNDNNNLILLFTEVAQKIKSLNLYKTEAFHPYYDSLLANQLSAHMEQIKSIYFTYVNTFNSRLP